MRKRAFASAAAIGLALGFVGVAHATEYTLTTWSGGPIASASGINASGQSAGTVNNGVPQAVMWSATGSETVLSTPLELYANSAASGINASGQIVGSVLSASFTTTDAAMWSPTGQLTILAGLGGSQSVANGINPSGQIVGYATTPGDAAQDAVKWSSTGHPTILNGLGGTQSSALGINASGQSVGYSWTADTASHAVLWSSTGLPTVLGTGVAEAINASGQSVGYSETADSTPQAMMWDSTGRPTVLRGLGGAANSDANGINASGQIVGYASTAGGGIDPVLWNSSGLPTDLNRFLDGMPGIFATGSNFATAINDAGDIIGYSFNNDCCDAGGYQSDIWVLAPVATGQVPEPATMWLVLLALSGLLGTRWLRERVSIRK